MSKNTTTRRDFIRRSSALAAVGAGVPYFFTGADAVADDNKSKNDRLNVAGVGVGGRGSAMLAEAAQFGDVVAVCDVDAKRSAGVAAKYGEKTAVYTDYRKLLERDDIDIVISGTPDHWHTAVCVAACRAGIDVYTEKPMTLTIDEGRIMSKVVKETGRVVQVGTMQRSGGSFQTAVELVRNGRIGKLKQVWVALPYYTTQGGPFPKAEVPAHLDWDMYQGQAPEHDYCAERTHANFRWWYEYAGGIITDWGNHHVDIAQWGIDAEDTGPISIDARGLFPNPKGPEYYSTPDRFFSRMIYANGVEVLYFASMNQRRRYGTVDGFVETSPEKLDWLFGKDVPEEIKAYDRDGIMFIGDKGRVFVNRGGVYGKPVEELKENPLPADAWRVRPSKNHMKNFFDCVKSREEPVAPVRIQHRSISACHLTNISLRLGRKIKWDPKAEQVIGDAEANAMQKREQRKPYTVS